MHDLNVPSSIDSGVSFTLSDHLHEILYESETAPRLPGTPVARDLPFSCEPVHPAPINNGTARRPGVNRRAAGDFPIAREGGDELWDQRVLLIPETETAVARTAPDEDVSATRVNAGSRRAGGCRGQGTRRIAHPFESTARLCCGPAEIWTIFRSCRFFTRANRRRVGGLTSACRETRTTYPACLQSRTQSVHS